MLEPCPIAKQPVDDAARFAFIPRPVHYNGTAPQSSFLVQWLCTSFPGSSVPSPSHLHPISVPGTSAAFNPRQPHPNRHSPCHHPRRHPRRRLRRHRSHRSRGSFHSPRPHGPRPPSRPQSPPAVAGSDPLACALTMALLTMAPLTMPAVAGSDPLACALTMALLTMAPLTMPAVAGSDPLACACTAAPSPRRSLAADAPPVTAVTAKGSHQ